MKNYFSKKFLSFTPVALMIFALQVGSFEQVDSTKIENPKIEKNNIVLDLPALSYGVYTNEKFSFERIYPDNLMETSESLEDNGITLTSKDGQVDLKIYGSLDASISNFQELFLLSQEKLKVSNKKLTTGYFYVSGSMVVNSVTYIKYTQTQVVYTTDTNGNAIQYLITVQITYPESQSELYDQYCSALQQRYLN